MIYLAFPYSHSDADVRQQRFESACCGAATSICQGKTAFSPIAHGHPICAYGLPFDRQFWERHDRHYLEARSQVVVLMLAGWQESKDIRVEIAIAQMLGKPVSFVAMNGQAEDNPGQSRG